MQLRSLLAAIPGPVAAGQLVPHEPERELDPMCVAIEDATDDAILAWLRLGDGIAAHFAQFLATQKQQ